MCPGIPGYCSEAFLGQACNFDCSYGPNIRSTCGPDGTWEPYPTCQGDLRETQDGCNGCPGANGRARNRTAEAILGIEPVNQARPQDFGDRRVRPSFAGNVAFGPTQVTTPRPAPRTTPRPAPPRTTARPAFVPNLAAAGLRTTVTPRQQQPRRFDPRRPAQNQIPQTKARIPQQQPRIPQQQQPRIPQQQQSIFNQQQPRFPQQQPAQNPRVSQLPQQQFAQNPRIPPQQNVQNPRLPQQTAQAPRQQPTRQGSGGFSQQQLSIIRNGISRLNSFGGFGSQQTQQQQPRVPQQQQPRVPQQQQPRIPQQQQPRIPQQQQPRIPQQQQPRIAPQQQPRIPQQQQPRIAPQQQQQPRVVPQPQQQPRQPPPSQGAQPKTTQLTALQRAILKNAGVTKIPDQIEKVEKIDPSQPRFVNNIFAEENTSPRPVSVSPVDDDRFFGAFEVVPLGSAGLGGPLGPRDLPAFPAIPDGQIPQPGDPNFGPFQVVDL